MYLLLFVYFVTYYKGVYRVWRNLKIAIDALNIMRQSFLSYFIMTIYLAMSLYNLCALSLSLTMSTKVYTAKLLF